MKETKVRHNESKGMKKAMDKKHVDVAQDKKLIKKTVKKSCIKK